MANKKVSPSEPLGDSSGQASKLPWVASDRLTDPDGNLLLIASDLPAPAHPQVGFNAFGPLQGVVTAAGLTLPGMALIAFTSAVYNSGAYNAPASTFTAPVTGLYHFDLDVFFQQPVGSAYEISVAIVPSSGNAVQAIGQQLGSTALGVSGLGPWNLGMSLVASATVPLTLGDTVIAKFGTTHPGGPAQNAGGSHFSGYLVFPT